MAAREPVSERIKVRGLGRLSSVLFAVWGGLVALKGLFDLFWGEPEANLYAPEKWAFVTREQWMRWAGFELCYGLACLGLAWALWKYSGFLPAWIERKRADPEWDLFG